MEQIHRMSGLFLDVDRTPNTAFSLCCGSVQIHYSIRFSLERVWGLVNHLGVRGWWMKSEMVRDGWILVRRTRSKKTGNKWAKSRKAPAL